MRLKENVLASPEAIVRRVDSLAAVWIRLGALRPGGELTLSLRADWEASCRRLAQAMVTASEPVTISNALLTVWKLETWMQARQRNLPPGLIDLDNFVHQGTPAPTRSLNALRWLSKHGDLAWPLHRVTVPAVKVSKKKKGQAVVVGPPMLGYLEEQIEGLFKAGDQTWSALLGSWLVAVGVLRYKHISRSVPKKVSLSTFHAHVENNGVFVEASQPSPPVGTGPARGWSFGRNFRWSKRGVVASASIPMGSHGI